MKKKGRSQGGGPAIRTGKKKKINLSLVQQETLTRLAKKKKRRESQLAPKLVASRQAERHGEHLQEGASSFPVCARVRDTESTLEWLQVGGVSVLPGAMNPMDAARLQKRIILEHAVKLHPALFGAGVASGAWTNLELAVDLGSGPMEVVPEVSKSTGEEVKYQTARVRRAVAAATFQQARGCGFAGEDLGEGHYFSGNEYVEKEYDGHKVKRDRLGNDSKSVVAEAFSKQLGLRGS